MAINLTAFLWGFAEATLFFIVPDVWLSIVAMKNRDKALRACGHTLAGALIGGSFMFFLGSNEPAWAHTLLSYVPGIPDGFSKTVAGSLEEEGLPSMLFGPLQGIPYKLYAVISGSMGLNYISFILISVPARLVRFLVVAMVSSWIFNTGLKEWPIYKKRNILVIFWISFYCFYFYYVSMQ